MYLEIYQKALAGHQLQRKLKYLLLGLQTHVCIFVRSHRQEIFSKNVNVLEELATLSFALDHVN